MSGTRLRLASRLFVVMQYAIPQRLLSRGVHWLTRSRQPALKNLLIRSFVRGFHPEMSDAVQPDPLRYASFNEFFTRGLRSGTRPAVGASNVLVSPVDGTISQIGHIEGGRLLQAKGHDYTLSELLGAGVRGSAMAQRFAGGLFATLYLAPFNYHRIHMPADGTLSGAWYVPGALFSVNSVTASSVPRLFARNERVVCIFENGALSFALVLVGALFVGSMSTVWHGDVTPRRPRRLLELPCDESRSPLRLERSAEMGRFNMGSTVIVLLPPGAGAWLPELREGTPVRVGQALAQLSMLP